MIQGWSQIVLKNFEGAAETYNKQALLQRSIAWRLAMQCSNLPIPKGLWVDLGAGTGLLANALETCNKGTSVLRLDGSPGMLKRHHLNKHTKLWDLNQGLPSWPRVPTLLTSSFVLHWLKDPQARLKEWFVALPPGGWLVLAVPVEGSFPQWHYAANQAGVCCTAMPLPNKSELISTLPQESIFYNHLHFFTTSSHEVLPLLKQLRQIGAHASPKASLDIGKWRRVTNSWPRNENNHSFNLTWHIQLLFIRR